MKRIQRILFFTLTALFTGLAGFAQNGGDLYRFWNQGSLNGEIMLKGLYRDQTTILKELEESQQSRYIIGGIKLNTSAYLWKPDILKIYVGGEFNPESRNEKYLIVPDRSEARTLSKLDLRATLFDNKSVNLNSYLNLNQNYFNREYLTNIRSDNRQIGALLGISNKVLPMTVSYRETKWKQNEIQTGREFAMDQQNIESRITRSFGSFDKSELRISYDDYNYKYNDQYETNNQVKRINFNNSIWFDQKHNYSIISNILYHDQAGTYDFTKTEVLEQINFILPNNFRLNSGYNLFQLSDEYQDILSHRGSISLSHKLFESLYSSAFGELHILDHSLYNEKNLKAGAEVRYTKSIKNSKLNISYKYYLYNSEMVSSPEPIQIVNESHILSDGNITLLDKPFIDPGSIIIRDITGTIIYIENLDYLLSVRGDFFEITRIPGGQIANDQEILAEYISTQPGSYTYRANNNSLAVSFSLFRNFIEFYYRGSSQTYPFLIDAQYLTLNRYYQNIYGIRVNTGFANGGIEYDNYNSSIVPYSRTRLFLDMNWIIKSKFILSFNGNISDYRIIGEELNQIYANINGRVAYNISSFTRVSFESGYLSQTGKNIDLKLLTGKAEISHSVRKLQVKAGFEMYRRHYLESDIYFTGTYVQLNRKF